MTATDLFRLTGRPIVIGTGLLALDIVFSADDAMAPQFYAGGTCGNVLVILSYLGWKSYPVARLNEDAASGYVVKDLKRWAVVKSLITSSGLVQLAALGCRATQPSMLGLRKRLLRLRRSLMSSSSTVFPEVQSLWRRRVLRTGRWLFSSRQVSEIPDCSKRLSVTPAYSNTPTSVCLTSMDFVILIGRCLRFRR